MCNLLLIDVKNDEIIFVLIQL